MAYHEVQVKNEPIQLKLALVHAHSLNYHELTDYVNNYQ